MARNPSGAKLLCRQAMQLYGKNTSHPKYQQAYQEAIGRTSTAAAPWYVVPADRNWVRNLAVAKILLHHLEKLDPKMPPPEDGIDGLVVE